MVIQSWVLVLLVTVHCPVPPFEFRTYFFAKMIFLIPLTCVDNSPATTARGSLGFPAEVVHGQAQKGCGAGGLVYPLGVLALVSPGMKQN